MSPKEYKELRKGSLKEFGELLRKQNKLPGVTYWGHEFTITINEEHASIQAEKKTKFMWEMMCSG